MGALASRERGRGRGRETHVDFTLRAGLNPGLDLRSLKSDLSQNQVLVAQATAPPKQFLFCFC